MRRALAAVEVYDRARLECRAENWWSGAVNDSGWIAMVGGVAGFTVQSVVFLLHVWSPAHKP